MTRRPAPLTRQLALLALCAALCVGPAAAEPTCAPIDIPPSTAPEADRITWAQRPVWTVWDTEASPPGWVSRNRAFPSSDPAAFLPGLDARYRLLYQEPVAAPPASDPNNARHLVLTPPVETYITTNATRTDTGAADPHLGCVKTSQAWGWRPTSEVLAAIETLEAAANRDCAATITVGGFSQRTDYETICARGTGAMAGRIIAGTVAADPPAMDPALYCWTFEDGCAKSNATNADRLRANAAAARAGTVDPETGRPTQVADWSAGWRVAVPAPAPAP